MTVSIHSDSPMEQDLCGFEVLKTDQSQEDIAAGGGLLKTDQTKDEIAGEGGRADAPNPDDVSTDGEQVLVNGPWILRPISPGRQSTRRLAQNRSGTAPAMSTIPGTRATRATRSKSSCQYNSLSIYIYMRRRGDRLSSERTLAANTHHPLLGVVVFAPLGVVALSLWGSSALPTSGQTLSGLRATSAEESDSHSRGWRDAASDSRLSRAERT